MSFGKNLQFLRKMRNGMTQEALAESLSVSRQTVSKWEMEQAFPEMDKAIELAKLFSCTLDDLMTNDIASDNAAYSNMRVETVPGFRYASYAVLSQEPEEDAIRHITEAAKSAGIASPEIVGWDFPFLSQEQKNVFRMHGYEAAVMLPEGKSIPGLKTRTQADSKYAVITIEEPFANPFALIPNGYKTLIRYMEANGLRHRETEARISCYEKTYERSGKTYMDVFIAIEE